MFIDSFLYTLTKNPLSKADAQSEYIHYQVSNNAFKDARGNPKVLTLYVAYVVNRDLILLL